MSADYIPERGDIIRFDVNPGDENSGQPERKSAMIISPKAYNEKTGLALICPVKSKARNYPFEVLIPAGSKIEGIILSDQIKSMNWKTRNAELVFKVTPGTLSEVISRINTLI